MTMILNPDFKSTPLFDV